MSRERRRPRLGERARDMVGTWTPQGWRDKKREKEEQQVSIRRRIAAKKGQLSAH